MAAEKKSHKDWFDRSAAKALAEQLASVDKKFDQKAFVRHACRGLSALEFNARVKQFADAMAETLPSNYLKAVAVVEKSFPAPLPDCESVTDGWLQWPVGQFIADYGLNHFEASMHCMVALTKRFSAEYAIRPFVIQYPQQTFDYLYGSVEDPSPHVRRWCSEGVRTRLPWGGNLRQLIDDPSPILPILEALKDDSELYVRKSVANSLNDLSKDHPDLVIDICKRWSKKSNPQRDWIIKQGMRTLIKQGSTGALALSGYRAPDKINTTLKLDKKRVKVGESVAMQVTIDNGSKKPQPLLIDYVVHYQGKADNARRKVFKWTSLIAAPGEPVTLNKQHPMKQTTVRALYPGRHSIELQLNGKIVGSAEFMLSS